MKGIIKMFYYYIFYIIYNIINIFIIYKSIKTILNEGAVFNKKYEIGSYILYFTISTLMFLLYPIPLIMLFTNILIVFLIQFNYKTKIKNKILLTLYIITILSIIDTITSILINKTIISINIKNSYDIENIFDAILGWTFQLVLSFVSLKSIKSFRKMQSNLEMPKIFWLPLIVIPFISILLVLLFLYDKSSSVKLIIFLCVSLIIINLTIFALYDLFLDYTKSKIEKELLEREKEFNLKQFNIIINNYESLELFRHDFKNHISYIKKCSKDKNLDEIIKYIDSITREVKINKNIIINSGNIILDSILSFKFQEIINNNIRLEYKVLAPYDLKIDSLDLVSLLGNLIDNIIEANIKIENVSDRYSNINIKYIKNNLFINLENSFKEVKFDNNNNLKTLKKESHKHGLGLKSIKNIVDKYNGFIKMDIKENKFITKIVLTLEN